MRAAGHVIGGGEGTAQEGRDAQGLQGSVAGGDGADLFRFGESGDVGAARCAGVSKFRSCAPSPCCAAPPRGAPDPVGLRSASRAACSAVIRDSPPTFVPCDHCTPAFDHPRSTRTRPRSGGRARAGSAPRPARPLPRARSAAAPGREARRALVPIHHRHPFASWTPLESGGQPQHSRRPDQLSGRRRALGRPLNVRSNASSGRCALRLDWRAALHALPLNGG